MKSLSSCCLSVSAVLLACAPAFAQDEPAAAMTDKEKASYSVGVQLGNMVSSTPELIDEDALVAGLRDAMQGAQLKVGEEEMGRLLMDLQTKMQAAQRAQAEAQGAESRAEGEVYLAENAKQEGVKVLPSGLQYKVIKAGTGRTPTAADRVSTHYRGTFIDGNEFDSSYKRNEPAEFGVTQVIPGWTEALKLMKEGAKWELVIPYQLAYGETGRAGIPPYAVLKFEIELLKIVDQPKR